MSMSRLIDFNFPFMAGNFEFPIFIGLNDAILESSYMAFNEEVEDSDLDYTTFQIIDKGLDGLGNTLLDYITNNINDLNGKFISLSISKIAIPFVFNKQLLKGHVYSLKKIDNNDSIDLGFSSFVASERRY